MAAFSHPTALVSHRAWPRSVGGQLYLPLEIDSNQLYEATFRNIEPFECEQ